MSTLLIETIIDSLKVLDEMKGRSLEEIKSNRMVSDCVLWNLYVAIQSTIDLSLKAVIRLGLPAPDSYTEAFEILKESGIIKKELAEKLKGMVRFRQILAHRYMRIDLDKVYEVLQRNLEEIRIYLKVLQEALAKKKD
ncbi:MAG TPA: DUF86 domain-containing protein [Candidatus Korarchaeota archaeon]|nr:DUF86 domain-containing protein [Candidatus Korarchaeota archaeon]